MRKPISPKERARRKISRSVGKIIEALREYTGMSDASFESLDLANTPDRVARMYVEELHTPDVSIPKKHLHVTVTVRADIVAVGPIGFSSMCAHHMLPFHGTMMVAYLPEEKILGLSKFTRIVHHLAKAFQLQEFLTHDVKDALVSALHPRAIVVLSKASHGCVTCRGVYDPHQMTVCSALHTRGSNEEYRGLVDELYTAMAYLDRRL